MSHHPEVDETVQAAFAAVRAIVAARHRGDRAGRDRAGQVIDELIERRGQRAGRFAALFLAEIAATGMSNHAADTGVPVDRVLAQFEQRLLDHTSFAMLIAEQYPEGPPGLSDPDP